MVNLTFGEQVKIILSRKGMTIKELAERIEKRTGKNMSRQNMTQRLGRDNFQEQDMRLIADILGCSFQLSIMEPLEEAPKEEVAKEKEENATERDITVGELVQMAEELQVKEASVKEEKKIHTESTRKPLGGFYLRKPQTKTNSQLSNRERKTEEKPVVGEINPYTGKEYLTNSVRMHPKRIGYVQVYDQGQHKWTDMTEWAFLGYQERKKALLGKDYDPPIYLD